MAQRILRLGAGSFVVLGFVVLVAALAFAAPTDLTIDLGDPLIADDHLSFRDRGRYPYQDVACGAGCGGTCVNVVLGNLVYTRQDISIPGPGLPLEVRFTYNSGSFFEGRYGYGWQMNYDIRYVTNNINGNIIVVREDDRTDIFVKQPDGTFLPTYGVRDVLEEYQPGRFLLTDVDGVRYRFASDKHHYVTEIKDLNDNALSLTYNDQRALTSVSDGTGRSLTFAYTNDRLATVTDPAGRIFRYQYDGGNMIAVTDPEGSSTHYAYAAGCHDLTQITDAKGSIKTIAYNADYQVQELGTCCGSLQFAYDRTAQRTVVIDGNGQSTTYLYDGKLRVNGIRDAKGQLSTRTWEDGYDLGSVTDANGHTTSYTYDSRGNVLTETDAGGGTRAYTWHPEFNRVTSSTDANGHTTAYSYDPQGNLLSLTDPEGQITHHAYDAHGQVTSRTDPRGYTTHYQYDIYGNLEKQWLSGPTITTHRTASGSRSPDYVVNYSYDPVGNRISETDANGNVTTYSYDDLNRLVVITDALGYVNNYSYDPVGNRISETDANGHAISYSYDDLNRLVVITKALECVSTYSYDPVGNRISSVDANGNTTSYSYDSLNRLVVITDALGYVSNYSYDPVGNRIGETDANGHFISYSYDTLNRLDTITDALGHVSNYSYDPVGNRISETDANGYAISYSYDSLNRLDAITDALGYVNTYSYDPVGNRIGETDANGHFISYSYDGSNRLAVITDALGYTTTYSYDPVGNRIGETDANFSRWQYEYDPLNRLVTGTSPLLNQTAYEYDGVGNILRRTDPNGAETTHGYDSLGRLTSTAYPDGTIVEYAYDCVGNTLVITDGGPLAEIIERQYDGLHRLVSETIDYALFEKTVAYTYDKAGNMSTLTDPDGRLIQYEYDDADHLVEITYPTNRVTTMAYDPAGRPTETRFDSGVWTQYLHDNGNRLTDVTTRNASNVVLLKNEYVYDNAGRIVRVDKNGAQHLKFQYDAAGRLTQAGYPAQTITYTYDAVGNRMLKDDGVQLTNYLYDGEYRVILQDIVASHAIDYVHDANGCVTETHSPGFDVEYEYDYENHLTRFQYGLGPNDYSRLYYSPEGRLLARDEQGTITYYYPSLRGVVVEMDGSGQTTARLNPGISMGPGGSLAGQGVQATAQATIHWDGRDSTTYFTNDSGSQVAAFDFGYFGELLAASSVGDVDPGLYVTGMRLDEDPWMGTELIGGDYAPDIDQHYGATMFEPGEHLGAEYRTPYVQWYTESPWAHTDVNVGLQEQAGPKAPQPQQPAEKCTHGCYGFAWGSKYVEWKGEWKNKWSCREMDFVEACQNGKPTAQKHADEDCEYWDGPACKCKGSFGSAREFDWVKQRSGNGWLCYCKIVYRGDCVEK